MKNQFQISIPNPCQQNWQEMNVAEKGRFCNSCQKNVIDFTMQSDTAILKSFKVNQNLCGRFLPNQLDRILLERKEKSVFWQVGLASFLGFIGLGSQVSLAQEFDDKKIEQKLNDNSFTADKNVLQNRTEIEFVVFCYDVKEKTSFVVRNLNTKFVKTIANDETIKIDVALGDRIFIYNENFTEENFIIDEENIKNKFFTVGVNRYQVFSGRVGGAFLISKPSFFKKITRPIRNLFTKKNVKKIS